MRTKALVTIAMLILTFFNPVSAQNIDPTIRKELETVLQDFMTSITEKDSVKFYNLFYDGPVTWVGVDKEQSYQAALKKSGKQFNNYFRSSYKSFIRGIISDGSNEEEKFYNIRMDGDERIASVTFNYSYWSNGKRQNWGQESWALIRAGGKWKITSVIFSVEMENIVPEPSLKKDYFF